MGRASQASPKHATVGLAHARHNGPCWHGPTHCAWHDMTRLGTAAEPPLRCEEALAACGARRGMAWGGGEQAPAGPGGGVAWGSKEEVLAAYDVRRGMVWGGGEEALAACDVRGMAWSGREEALRCERVHGLRWAKQAYPRLLN